MVDRYVALQTGSAAHLAALSVLFCVCGSTQWQARLQDTRHPDTWQVPLGILWKEQEKRLHAQELTVLEVDPS